MSWQHSPPETIGGMGMAFNPKAGVSRLYQQRKAPGRSTCVVILDNMHNEIATVVRTPDKFSDMDEYLSQTLPS